MIFRFFYKNYEKIFFQGSAILMGTLKISVKIIPIFGVKSICHRFLRNFEKSVYLMFFKLWDWFWTVLDGLLDPLDRYKSPKKIQKSMFLTFFSYWTLGQP